MGSVAACTGWWVPENEGQRQKHVIARALQRRNGKMKEWLLDTIAYGRRGEGVIGCPGQRRPTPPPHIRNIFRE